MCLLYLLGVISAAAVVAWRRPWIAALVGEWPSWLIVALAAVSAVMSFAHMRRFGDLHPTAVPTLVMCSMVMAVAVAVA